MLWASLLKHLNTSVNDSLIVQNHLLKAQIRELQRQLPSKKRLIFSVFSKQEMARLGKQLSRQALEDACVIIRPSTLLRWYRTLVAAKFDGSKRRSYPGRPRIRAESEALVVEIAGSNPRWGADRIQRPPALPFIYALKLSSMYLNAMAFIRCLAEKTMAHGHNLSNRTAM